MWELLPDLILEEIFSLMSMKNKYNASLACKNWSYIIFSPRVWRRFIVDEKTLTRHKFNYYMGYENIIDHYRTQICLHKVARHFRSIIIKPLPNFFNLYEFIKMLYQYAEYYDRNPLSEVESFQFTFACHLAESGIQEYVFGTGGKLLDSLKRLMTDLPGLKCLSLTNLLLDAHEAMYLLDSVAENCIETLKKLEVINCTKFAYPLLHVGVFLALQELKISPQHLNDDIICLLGSTRLRNMYIIQTAYTEMGAPVSKEAWKECRRLAPQLNVHLIIDGSIKDVEIIWQPKAPVRSIIYKSPFIPVTNQSILTVVEMYKNDLRIYGHLTLPKFYVSKGFHERADSALVLLSRHCPCLETLFVRERISTATVLLLAHSAKNLKNYYVRRNAVIKKCDWPRSPDWTSEFYHWLSRSSASYDDTDKEVAQILQSDYFKMIQDHKFKVIDCYGFN